MLVSSKISSKVVSRGHHFFPILVLLSAFRTCFLFIILRYNVTNVVFNKWHSVDNGTLCQIALSNCVVCRNMQSLAESFRTFQKFAHACVRGNPSKRIAWFCYGGGPCGRHGGGRVGRHGGQVGGVIPCHDFTLCYGVSPCHYVTQCYGVILFDMAMSCYAVSTFMVLTLYVVCPGHFI